MPENDREPKASHQRLIFELGATKKASVQTARLALQSLIMKALGGENLDAFKEVLDKKDLKLEDFQVQVRMNGDEVHISFDLD